MNPILRKFNQRADTANTLLCIGLDSEFDKLPERFQASATPQYDFNRWIIDQTADFAAVYKLNSAFYEARGPQGLTDMHSTASYLRELHPAILTIDDAKRADIGNTNQGYVTAIFDVMGFDAITLHPYLGREALEPFMQRTDKACIILCRNSNPGAGELQDLLIDGKPLWHAVAERVARHWDRDGNCMLVVGATYPQEMRRIREVAPHLTFLVPGIGAQGGDVAQVVAAGLDAEGRGLMISSSRAIIFAADPAAAARSTRDEINVAREAMHVLK